MDRETAAEMFAAFGPVDVRRMFSGFGLYADDVCFGIYLRGEFYLKADETTIPRFVAAGSEPFSYSTRAKTVSVKSWWRMPARLYDEPEELAEWAREAVAIATKVKLKKVARKRTKQAAGAKKAAKQGATGRAERVTRKEPKPPTAGRRKPSRIVHPR